jgi:hypothetical protein
MDIGKRERIIVGALLLILTPYVVWQWGIRPDAYWRRAELRRKSLEKELAKKKKTIDKETAVRAMIGNYEQLVHRYPKHPKSAAARVIIVGLMEQWDKSDLQILKVRAGLATFYGDKRAAIEVEKLLKDTHFGDIADEVLACTTPRSIAQSQSVDTLVWEGQHFSRHVSALDSTSGKKKDLPLNASKLIVPGSQIWRHDLHRVAFATIEEDSYGKHDYAARWTIWVADFQAGRLRAFLPSHPLPDLTQMEEPLLVWSSDGKRLKCRDETFVVD